MKTENVTVVDFETEEIAKRPAYPPAPVGVSLRYPSGEKEYLAFNHPEGNNTTVGVVKQKLAEACRDTVVFHNAAFDMDVMDIYFHLRPKKFEDTLYLGFLNNPHEEELGLKPMAAKYLNMPPTEQRNMDEWILEHVPGAKRKKKQLGSLIGKAPGHIVAPYANGDTERTWRLWKMLRKNIYRRSMEEPYQRELDLTWTTLEMERSGVRIDMQKLRVAEKAFERLDELLQRKIRKTLNVSDDFNLNSKQALGIALYDAKKLSAVVRTPTGRISVKIEHLHKICNDQSLLRMLSVHSVCEKYLNSFIRPWLIMGERTGGRILPTFNQCRGRNDRGGGGTRTGRYSSADPNLQQVAVNVDESKNKDVLLLMQSWLKRYCDLDFIGMRDFILPDEGMVLLSCDYDQQELRLLGHFEDGALREAYADNPKLDVHEFVKQLVKEILGIEYPRKSIKITNFGLIYGMGVPKLAASLGVDRDTAAEIRNGVLKALPGVKRLQRDLADLEDTGSSFRTWGGREYFTEEPKEIKGEFRHFGYKNLNTIIQGSAADITKEGMLRVREEVPDCRIAIQVHDELIVMAPDQSYAPRVARAMTELGNLRVPMVCTPKISTESWGKAA